jgi:hypothetical protein
MFVEPQNPEISVSDLLLYHNCPRKVYFVSRGYVLFPEINVSRIERMFLKELSLTYPESLRKVSLNADDLQKTLEVNLTQVHIYHFCFLENLRVPERKFSMKLRSGQDLKFLKLPITF